MNWIIMLFGVFIIACGGTHVMKVWNLGRAQYWLAGGLKAITAYDGEQAIGEFHEQGDRIDALLLDVVMAKIKDAEACARIGPERPEVPVIFARGYRPDRAASQSPRRRD